MDVIFVKYINMNSHKVKLYPVQTPEMPSARDPQWAGDTAEGNCCNLMRR